MGLPTTRSGAPTEPTVTTAGTPGSVTEVRAFDSYARPCFVTNTDSSDDLYVKINEDDASDTSFLCKLEAGQAVELSGGRINVKTVSLYYASAAYAKAEVRGWIP